MDATEPLLRVRDLRVHFSRRRPGWFAGWRHIPAVDGIDLDLSAGETLALVGESGCGKSTTARAICSLVPADGGSIRLCGRELVGCTTAERRASYRDVQLVFQDPYSALDPRLTAADCVAEPLRCFGIAQGRKADARARELLEQVGLQAADGDRYPHAFSGGQRQRIVIARALAAQPKVLICDEAVSALDVSVQARILDLLRELQQRLGLAQLFITHDLAVAWALADRVAVMHDGRIVETGSRAAVFHRPQHAYTRQLLRAVPIPDPERARVPGAQAGPEVAEPSH